MAEIADLLAWARRLTDAGRHAEHGTYQAAKTDLARITAATTSSTQDGGN
jgi:hypothetical protein